MNTRSQSNGASLQWQPSQAVFEQDACWFDHAGCRYYARRDAAGSIVYLAKRARSNRRGAHYQPMNIKGAAARLVIKAVQS